MILITGATGNNGSEVIKRLSELHIPVRAMVRKPTKALPEGVELSIADFDDSGSLRRALEGATAAFLVTPSSEKVEEQQLEFVRLARECGVQHVVYVSQLHATRDSPVRYLRYHAAVEQALLASGMAYTNLRPNLYMQSLQLWAPLIQAKGQIMAPIGNARVSVVDVRDIADVAVAALTDAKHRNATYDITGPEALTHIEMAEQLSAVLGRTIEFVEIPPSAFQDNLLSAAHMPEWQADGLLEDYAHYGRGEAAGISSDVKTVTGNTPRSFARFAHDYKERFLQQGAR